MYNLIISISNSKHVSLPLNFSFRVKISNENIKTINLLFGGNSCYKFPTDSKGCLDRDINKYQINKKLLYYVNEFK